MNNKRKKMLGLCWTMGAILCILILFILLGGVQKMRQLILHSRDPWAYTWDEYQAMDPEQQDEFFQRFASTDEFEAWMDSVHPKETLPDFQWTNPGKLPNAYTWEEYDALTAEQKEAFYQWFGSTEEFENWMNQVKPDPTTDVLPEWNTQGKQPDEYTWDEYQKLSPEEQDAFFLWFRSREAFETWMKSAKPEENNTGNEEWNQTGKQPDQYTWAEYQTLSPVDKDLFYGWFASREAFEAWMKSAKPEENSTGNEEWNQPGKQPDQYIWAEYQALSPEEQDLFYRWFPSMDAFEAWMDQAQQE